MTRPRNYFGTTTELDWEAQKADIIVNDMIAPKNYALVRSDNNAILDIHKNSYNPFPNSDFKKYLDELQKITGFDNLSYQEYKGGKVILGYLENNTSNVKVNGFDVDKYLILGNTHDGSKGTFIGTSEIMLRCMNQFGKIVTQNVIRHTKNSYTRLDELKNAYELYFKQTEALDELYVKMNKIHVDSSLLEALTQRLFDAENKEEISTRKANQILLFKDSYATESKDLGENLFGFFHATTHYTTHKVDTENVFGNIFGTQNKLNERSLEIICDVMR